MNVIFLLSRYTYFFENVIKEIIKISKVDRVSVVYWDNDHLPIEPTLDIKKINLVRRIDFDLKLLLSFSGPNLVYLPGWMDKGYLYQVEKLKNEFLLITCMGFDDQWHGTIRQILGSIYFRLFIKKFIDFAWIAGPPQYFYARKFGFSNERIIYNLLSSFFCNDFLPNTLEGKNYVKKFIFVGRLVKEKNLENLLQAFSFIDSNLFHLEIVGDGPLFNDLVKYAKHNIIFRGYLPPISVIKQLKSCDVFIMPSIHEQWSVAVHEAVSLGLVLNSSKYVGANSRFLIEGYNGFSFNPLSVDSIKESIIRILALSNSELLEMKSNSFSLSKGITPKMAAFSFISMNYKYDNFN